MKRINILLAESFLQNVCCETSINEFISNQSKKLGIDTALLYEEKGELIKLINTMTNDFEREMSTKIDDVKYYFSHPDNQNKYECLFQLVLILEAFDQYTMESAETLERNLMNISGNCFLTEFSKRLYSYNNYYIKNDASVPENIDSVDIMRFILASAFPSEVKYKLQDIFLNREKHIKKLCSIINDTLIFLYKYENEINIQLDKFYQYWDRIKGKRTFYSFLIEEFDILSQLEEHPAGYCLIPSFSPLTISLSIPAKDDNPNCPAILAVGLFFGEVFTIDKLLNSHNRKLICEDVLEALKLLSDKSRFEIMKFIRDKEAYGNEIAEHLNLTTATVSHHMGVLLSAGLINIEKRSGKMYYKVNHELVKEYLDYFEERLL